MSKSGVLGTATGYFSNFGSLKSTEIRGGGGARVAALDFSNFGSLKSTEISCWPVLAGGAVRISAISAR